MSSFQQEQLFGYILDALDDNEKESLERRLIREPDLREELATARQRMRPLQEAVVEFEPPPGLAERTCRFVATESEPRLASFPRLAPRFLPEDLGEAAAVGNGVGSVGLDGGSGEELLRPEESLQHIGLLPPSRPLGVTADRSGRRPMSEDHRSGSWEPRFGLVDVATTVAIVVLAAILIFPAISESRFESQVLACSNKLRNLGVAMTEYSRGNDGYFPRVPSEGKLSTAGIYAPLLADAGLIHDASQLTCPGGPQPTRHAVMRLPTMDQLEAMPEDQLADIRSEMGGSFGYNIGYTEEGQYRNTKNLGRSHFALMSDSPGSISADVSSGIEIGSPNHGGRGQNVLFEDGRVKFLSTAADAAYADHFFTNDDGLIAAGIQRDDSVIGSSETPPILQ